MPCQRFFVLSDSGVPRTFVDDCSIHVGVLLKHLKLARISRLLADDDYNYLQKLWRPKLH